MNKRNISISISLKFTPQFHFQRKLSGSIFPTNVPRLFRWQKVLRSKNELNQIQICHFTEMNRHILASRNMTNRILVPWGKFYIRNQYKQGKKKRIWVWGCNSQSISNLILSSALNSSPIRVIRQVGFRFLSC